MLSLREYCSSIKVSQSGCNFFSILTSTWKIYFMKGKNPYILNWKLKTDDWI